MKEFMKTKWGKAAIVIVALQLVASVIFVAALTVLNLLPSIYLVAVGTLLLLLLLLDFKLLFSQSSGVKKSADQKAGGKEKKGYLVKRVLGTVIASLVVLGAIVGSVAISILGTTLGDIFSDVKVQTDTTNIYVLKDDPAQKIEDAADYTFGVVSNVNWTNTQKAIDKINERLDREITVRKYEDTFAMVDALKEKRVGAILLNEAYVSVLEDVKAYSDFSEKTRILYSTTEEIEQKVEEKEDVTEKPFIVYLSGSDTRKKTLKAEKARSDVNLIAVINPKTRQILLVSTPRDSYVYTTVSGEMRDKLTHCGIYGIDCSMGTLENLYGIDITHYAQINFTGFETLIDAIGGIDCYSEKETYTREGHFHLDEGMNHMSGEVALAFVRDRFTYPDGDFARSRHQMEVIRAVVEKASSASTIVENYGKIMKSLKGMFTTDFQSKEFSALAKMQLADMSPWNVKTFTIDGEGAKTYTYSMPTQRSYVMYMNPKYVIHAKDLIRKVTEGGILTDEDVKNVETAAENSTETETRLGPSEEGSGAEGEEGTDDEYATGRPILSENSGDSGETEEQ